METSAEFSDLLGKTLTKVVASVGSFSVVFTTIEGETYELRHDQCCCEDVRIEDICGDLSDLVWSPLRQAEESTNAENPKGNPNSFTWTFYRLATNKGAVTIRFYGTSNGYYSERVDFYKLQGPKHIPEESVVVPAEEEI